MVRKRKGPKAKRSIAETLLRDVQGTSEPTRAEPALRSIWQSRSPNIVVVSALAMSLAPNEWCGSCSMFTIGSIVSTAQAQSAASQAQQLRANLKSAAEALNNIASAAPDMIRAMFAGNTKITSANVLALNDQSIAAQARLEKAFLAAKNGGALSPDESKELERLGELTKKASEPVKANVAKLKSALALPLVGGETAVRLAPKSDQDAAIDNADKVKKAVGALLAAIRKLQ